MARKMIKLRLVFEVEDETPSAMPSAAAWMTRPVVVDMLREGWGKGTSMPPSSSASRLGEEVRCGLPRLSRAM